MPRPSRHVDQALLRSGRALLPSLGCAGLTQRRLAQHAGVQPGMFHYHFDSKDAFLRTLLAQLYEDMFARLAGVAGGEGAPLQRLECGLVEIGRFAREHAALLGRLVADAVSGVDVAQDFLRDNAPRHLRVLARLMQEAEADGSLPAADPMNRLLFVMGATVMPMIAAQGMVALRMPMTFAMDGQVLDDDALRQRVRWALAALCAPERTT